MTIPHITPHIIVNSSPVALVACVALLLWMQFRHHHTLEEYTTLEQMLARISHSAKADAQEAFDQGDFQRAIDLIDPKASDVGALLLQARALECQCHFARAAEAYSKLEELPGKHLAAVRGRTFCDRMASDRGAAAGSPSRETLYRLHEDLMRRHDAATARLIARKLLPDPQPLRDSLFALLRQLDSNIQLGCNREAGLVDVTVNHWHPEMADLLRDLRLGTLNLSQSGIQDLRALAGLDMQTLDLSDNPISDLSALRALGVRQLRLDYTNVADLRPLAGMPLRELHLAHTLIKSLQPLAYCPLCKLDVSCTAVTDIEPLRATELRELDLSHTHVADLSPLASMQLERLALSDTAVHDLRALTGARLKSLTLARTAIKDLDALTGMPITELDLRGCELLTDVGGLAQCPLLERVYLPRHIMPAADHWNLPRLKFIEAQRSATAALTVSQ